LFAQRTRIPTSARSIGFCAIWVCISSSSKYSDPNTCAPSSPRKLNWRWNRAAKKIQEIIDRGPILFNTHTGTGKNFMGYLYSTVLFLARSFSGNSTLIFRVSRFCSGWNHSNGRSFVSTSIHSTLLRSGNDATTST